MDERQHAIEKRSSKAVGRHAFVCERRPMTSANRGGGYIDFAAMNDAALPRLREIGERWLPDGRANDGCWMASSCRNDDRKTGVYTIILDTGRWAALVPRYEGEDVISLATSLFGLTQSDAARQVPGLLAMLNEFPSVQDPFAPQPPKARP